MGGAENSLRHLGMIRTSQSWRRHFFAGARRVCSILWRRT